MTRSSKPTGNRVRWVDAAKGLSISLVVLFHATLIDATPPSSGLWWVVNAVFSTLRMPLFFLASGLFAASVLRKRWPDMLRGRILLLVYVYLLWLTIRQILFSLIAGDLELTWRSYVLPTSDMWFLYVLAAFFVVARALRPIPAAWQIAGAAAASIATSSTGFELYRFDEMLSHFVFFLIGCYCSQVIRDRARGVSWVTTALAWGLFLGASVAITAAGLRTVPPFRFLLSVIAVVAGITLAVVLTRSPLGRPLVYVGSITLPIYVMHAVFITGIVEAAKAVGWDLQPTVVGPLALAIVSLAASVVAYRILHRVPGLFAPPDRLIQWLSGSAVSSPVPPVEDLEGSRPTRRET